MTVQKTCLIVDDSDVVRRMMRTIIEDLGFQVDDTATTDDALKRCKAKLPDLIVLDWHIPACQPIEFLAAVRSLPTGRQAKVLYVLTNNDRAEIGRGITAGADDYMIKPFYRVGLETKVTTLTTTKREGLEDDVYFQPPLRTGTAV